MNTFSFFPLSRRVRQNATWSGRSRRGFTISLGDSKWIDVRYLFFTAMVPFCALQLYEYLLWHAEPRGVEKSELGSWWARIWQTHAEKKENHFRCLTCPIYYTPCLTCPTYYTPCLTCPTYNTPWYSICCSYYVVKMYLMSVLSML